MAVQQEEEDLAFSAAYEDDTPTPLGWKRKLVPRIGKGMVPVRTDVIFITPSGEEFQSKAKLQRYLKANKGGPSPSEFIWIVDGMPQRSTRSKSAPMVKLLEIPSRAADSKRKRGADINEAGTEKRRRTGKPLKPEEGMKGNDSKDVDMGTLGEEKEKGTEVTGSSPASAKKKRSVKVRITRGPAVAKSDSSNANGVADISNKDDKAEEPVKKSSLSEARKGKRSSPLGKKGTISRNPSSNTNGIADINNKDDKTDESVASKRKRSNRRSLGKKGTIPQDPSDDLAKEADVGVAADVSSAGATNAESEANLRGEGDHLEESLKGKGDQLEEGAGTDHNNEMMAANA